MLLTVVFPFCDFRGLIDSDFRRLPRPGWPDPALGHLRGIGGVRLRFLRGFSSWIGENSLVCGIPAMTVDLPHWLPGGVKQGLVRKACYFDGLVNGRFELLVRIDPEPASFAEVARLARDLLDRPAQLPRPGRDPDERPLGRQGGPLARLWASATVKRGADPQVERISAGRPFVIAETDARLEPVPGGSPAGIRFSVEADGKPFELFVIYPPADAPTGRGSPFRFAARTMRTYLLRMLQDVEALSQLCGIDEVKLDDDRVQEVFNEYTRHIMRSRAGVDVATDLVAYCYAAFARLYPGRIDGLRRQVAASPMRPNVRRKLLELLDEVEKAETHVEQNFYIGKVEHMGDKYDRINVTGSQGTAIGRGARAEVSDSTNQVGDPEVVAALRDLAAKVRESGNEEAAIEAEMIENAAAKAEAGDEKGAVALLKKVGKWALGVGTTVGTAALNGFLKSHGIG